MSTDVQNLVQSALTLAPADRIELAERILESLDDVDQASVDSDWVQEAEDRLVAHERGELPGLPYDGVMRELRNGNAP